MFLKFIKGFCCNKPSFTSPCLFCPQQSSIKLHFSSHIDGVITGADPFGSVQLAAGYNSNAFQRIYVLFKFSYKKRQHTGFAVLYPLNCACLSTNLLIHGGLTNLLIHCRESRPFYIVAPSDDKIPKVWRLSIQMHLIAGRKHDIELNGTSNASCLTGYIIWIQVFNNMTTTCRNFEASWFEHTEFYG